MTRQENRLLAGVAAFVATVVAGLTIQTCSATGAEATGRQKSSATRILAWKANPAAERVRKYRVYDARTRRMVASVNSNFCQVARGHSYFVTAVNVRGEGPRSKKIQL